MKPKHFKNEDTVLGAPQDWNEAEHGQCEMLPIKHSNGVCISHWSLTWTERFKVLLGGSIIVNVASGRTQPPIMLEVEVLERGAPA